MRVPFSPHPGQHLQLMALMVAILTGVRILVWFGFVFPLWPGLLNVFMCFLAIWTSSFEKALPSSFSYFFLLLQQ
jgi:hypothetical protein